jgi:3-oxoacyl-[acyl-carrier-protein] synthase II
MIERMNGEPVVISGIGLAASLGISAEEVWRGILQSRRSIGAMPALESAPPSDAGGYQAADLPVDFAPELPREARYLRWTIEQALADARAAEVLATKPERCGIVLGTTLHGMRGGGAFLRSGDFKHLRDFLAGNTLAAAVEGLGFAGEALTTCSACSSSLASIALAVTLLESGRLDLVVAGGYDTVSEYAYAGFSSLRLVAAGPLRPFARDRQGMKLGEGYGIVVLERTDDAARRGITPLAVILGCGESSDAHHLTQPHPQGAGAAAAIACALADAQIDRGEIGLVAAHATGTPDNDAGEYHAYSAIFGDSLNRVPVVGFKSHLGHTLGGAGAVELILSALALRDQIIPATANSNPAEVEFGDLRLVTGEPQSAAIPATLNTSLGFGGANVCVILALRNRKRQREDVNTAREVCITGIGVVLPGAIGSEAFRRQLDASPAPVVTDSGSIPESDYVHLLNARRVRRMSDYVKLTLAAANLAFADAGVREDASFAAACPAIVGSTHAGAAYCVSYYQQIVREGMAAANPMLFAEGVPNAAAAHLSLMLGLKGLCQTIIGTRTAGLDALRQAFLRIASGRWNRAVVSAAEEFVPVVNSAYASCQLHAPPAARGPFAGEHGFAIGCGAVTLVLESRESLERRSGRSRGTIAACAGASLRPNHALEDVARLLRAIGQPTHLISSACGTWVDRLEAAAITRQSPGAIVSSLAGYFPETFSVGPLAAVAAALLRKRLPTLSSEPIDLPGTLTAATGEEAIDSVGLLCTGFNGTAAAAKISIDRG